MQFSPAVAEDDLRRYRRNGPNRTTAILVEELCRSPLNGARLIDVGGGIGVIGVELLARGVAHVTLVEAAAAYATAAEAEYARRGLAERVQVFSGDYVALPESCIPPADFVTLDRVVCCYPEYEPLLERAVSHARRLLGLSYPRDRWYVRVVMALQNAVRRLIGNPFRTFVHPPGEMAALLERHGLRLAAHRGSLVWAVDVYERAERAGAEPVSPHE